MTTPPPNRRRALKTLFCSSAWAALNLREGQAEIPKPRVDAATVHLLAIGDFGTTGAEQRRVARAMEEFTQSHGIVPDGLFLLGDNFYSRAKDGFSPESERWKTTFEEVYPASVFPGPCWAVLGNHDYHDNPGGEKVQLAYAARAASRWRMPAKWYRFEVGPASHPFATVLALDSNLPTVSGKPRNGKVRASLTREEAEEQQVWLEAQLQGPRAPFTLVMAHHPLYSNGDHGDTEELVKAWDGAFEEHRVHAYFCGHDHDLQHLELEARFTSHILSGGGGARTRKLEVDRKMPFGRDVHGFTHLQLSKATLTVTHHDAGGRVLHRFNKASDGKVEIT